MPLTGWLLDAYPRRDGMVVWLLADDGRRLKAVEPWRPAAYVEGSGRDVDRLIRWLAARGAPSEASRTRKRELSSGSFKPVWEIRVGDAARFVSLLARARDRFPDLTWYNADLHPDRYWFYETGRFPLARVEAEVDGERLAALRCLDSIWDLEPEPPPFATLGLRLGGPGWWNPAHGGRRGALEVHLEGGQVRELDAEDPDAFLDRLNALLREHDPDLLVVEHGDAWLLGELATLAEERGAELALNRDPERAPRALPARSYFSYGRLVHVDAQWTLYGRLHLDRHNSFTLSHTGFTGTFETARLGRLPVQVAAHSSPGTGISSMQAALAVEEGWLVPVDKAAVETFKTADELLAVDKGGLTYQPPVGLYAGVGELDFASMYPSIMVARNLSPETINCACCGADGAPVPEHAIRVCRRRRGLIPRVLAPLLDKRARYKALKRRGATPAAREHAKACADAHKWLLVCCFGYLGYKNARFGRIEAHEATTAWGRETLLLAKETAERMGFTVLHALVDSLWVLPESGEADAARYEALTAAVEEATGLPVAFEGRYRWIAFLPSRRDPRVGVPQRYVGAFDDGALKARGIEARRHDTPPCVRALQEELIAALARARTLDEGRAIAAELETRVAEAVAEIRSGRLRPRDLVVERNLTRAPPEYRRASPAAVAAGQLWCRGVRLDRGERIGYVLAETGPRALALAGDGLPYDAEAYVRLALQAARTVLDPWT